MKVYKVKQILDQDDIKEAGLDAFTNDYPVEMMLGDWVIVADEQYVDNTDIHPLDEGTLLVDVGDRLYEEDVTIYTDGENEYVSAAEVDDLLM